MAEESYERMTPLEGAPRQTDGGLEGKDRMSHQMNGGQWDADGWGATTGRLPDVHPGLAGAPVGTDQQWWDAPTPRSSSAGQVVLVIGGILAAVLIVGLIAVGAFLVVDRDSGTETAAGGSTQSADSDPGAESAAGGAVPAPEEAAAQEPVGGSELAPASGTYVGTLSQRGTRFSDVDYPVVMTFSPQGSTVEYPTLGCSATLTPAGDSNGARVYFETITSGSCDSTGTWHITKGSVRAVSAEYRPTRADYVVVGQLTR